MEVRRYFICKHTEEQTNIDAYGQIEPNQEGATEIEFVTMFEDFTEWQIAMSEGGLNVQPDGNGGWELIN